MSSSDPLLRRVDGAFADLGGPALSWPRPDRSPLEGEYSRVLDQCKYAIVDLRVDAWVRALVDSGLAETDDEPLDSWADCVLTVARVRRVVPTRPGAPSLVLASTLVDDAPFGVLSPRPGAARHRRSWPAFPFCGCDDGSAALLDDLDGWVLTVVQGEEKQGD